MIHANPMCMDPPKHNFAISQKMLRGILFLILFIFLIPPPVAKEHPIAFVASIEEHLEIDSMIETKDGEFAFVIAERPPHVPQTIGHACFIKTDKNGKILFNITLPHNSNETYRFLPNLYGDLGQDADVLPLNYIYETAAGNYLVVSFSSYKPALIKISHSGKILWVKDSLVELEDDFITNEGRIWGRISRIIETSDGKFLLIGLILDTPLCQFYCVGFRTWITKIDNQGVKEWSRVLSGKIGDAIRTQADELIVLKPPYLLKYSNRGILAWNRSFEYDIGDDSFLLYGLANGCLLLNNTRLQKYTFDGEIEWTTEFMDSRIAASWNGLPLTRLFISKAGEYLVVSRKWEYEYLYNGDLIEGETLYKYRISQISISGDIISQNEVHNINTGNIGDQYSNFIGSNNPVYLTPTGLLIIAKDMIAISNNGTISSRSFNIQVEPFKAGMTERLYYTIYQISDDKFIMIQHSDVYEEIGLIQFGNFGYVNKTMEISCFDLTGSSLWSKNITYKLDWHNPVYYNNILLSRITSDHGLVMLVSEYNNTEAEYPLLFLKINEQGSIPWIYRFTFTSIAPMSVSTTKVHSLELDISSYTANWFFPISIYGIFLICIFIQRRRP